MKKEKKKKSKHRLGQESHHERLEAGDQLAQAGLQAALVAFHFLQGSVFQDLEKAQNTVENGDILPLDRLIEKWVKMQRDWSTAGPETSNRTSHVPPPLGAQRRFNPEPTLGHLFLSQGGHTRWV